MVELGEQPVMGEQQVELEVVEKNLLSQDLDFSKYHFACSLYPMSKKW